jgi:RimJ/RimL family protein N-acetyltransferase
VNKERAVGQGQDTKQDRKSKVHNSLARNLYQALPLKSKPMTIRHCTRADLDLLVSWPRYPWPYQAFDFSFRSLGPAERDAFFAGRVQREDRITLVCDRGSAAAIGYVALLRIDWHSRTAGNMSLRVHPDWCGMGIGTHLLQMVSRWWFGLGMQALQLDVAASNQRAVGCYLKAGFAHAEEFWREAPDLQSMDSDDERYDFLRDHVRFSGPVPKIRFYWMRRTTGGAPPAPGGKTARWQGVSKP